MTSAEWTDWLARASQQPLWVRRIEIALGRVVSWLLQPHQKSGSEPVQPGEVTPDWWKDLAEAGAVDGKAVLMALATEIREKPPGMP